MNPALFWFLLTGGDGDLDKLITGLANQFPNMDAFSRFSCGQLTKNQIPPHFYAPVELFLEDDNRLKISQNLRAFFDRCAAVLRTATPDDLNKPELAFLGLIRTVF